MSHLPRFTLVNFSYVRSCCFLRAIDAVVVRRKSTRTVTHGNYRLLSGQRASTEAVPPSRDRQSSGSQMELISWWLVPDLIHGTSSSAPRSRYNRLAWNIMEHHFLATTDGSSLGSFLAWVSKIRPTGDQRQDCSDSPGDSHRFASFLNESTYSWELERNRPRKTQKTAFSGVINAF